MLTKTATYQLRSETNNINITITPLFLQNHQQPWQPNEIYELSVADDGLNISTPATLGKIVVDENMDWHYEGEHDLSEEDITQLAQFVLSQI